MSSRRTVRQLLVAVSVGVLVGGGLMVLTPAGAEVSSAVATNWKKIWNKELKPQADQRYYTKKKSDKRYYTKSDADAKYQPKGSYALNGSSYTKAESDGRYYTKTDSDGRYARSAALVRGNILLAYNAAAAGGQGSSDISLGATFSAAPTVHVIPVNGAVPAGCAGSAAAPDASPGHLCIFSSLNTNTTGLNVCRPSTATCNGTADPWGAVVYASATAAGLVNAFATWAARPISVVTTSSRPSGDGGVSPGATGSGTR
ncbi:hypothetical protein NYO98_12150 [Nocardioides sp. STR2]|uniref:Uncharacterized protein n=1 Tax=Nocardioides pini TaxID=2975053 RepID=A0ABT4CFW8_9ACTN|nr:hypothetical protein [Nocardioides pini]MCY4727029.1 hypothetical protein [Nocardioides pini]